MKKQSYQDITQTLERRTLLEQEFEDTERKTWGLSSEIQSLSSKLVEAKQAVAGWRETHQRSKYPRDLIKLQESISNQESRKD